MLVPTIVLGVIAVILFGFAWNHSGSRAFGGFGFAGRMTLEILPMIFFAFVIAAMIQMLLPKEMMAKWVGTESGWKGILIGTVAGGFAPGGPYVSMPIAAGLLQGGAGMGTMVAFVTSWSLWAVARLPLEVGIMGWKFVWIRLVSTFFFPPIAGWIAHWISRAVR